MASPFKGSDHIKPPDRKGPSNGDCLESGRRHMALVCKKQATDAMLDQMLCICSSRRPTKSCTEGVAYKGPGCGVVPAESGVDFSQELPPFHFGDASLEHSGGTILIELSLMDPVGLRLPHYAACLILVLRKFLPS